MRGRLLIHLFEVCRHVKVMHSLRFFLGGRGSGLVRCPLTNQIMRICFLKNETMKMYIQAAWVFMKNVGETTWSVSDAMNTIGYVILSLIHRKNQESVRESMQDLENLCLWTLVVGFDDKVWYPSHFVLDILKRAVKFGELRGDGILVGKSLRFKCRNGVYFVFQRQEIDCFFFSQRSLVYSVWAKFGWKSSIEM